MATVIPRIRPQTLRFRRTLERLECFMRDVLANRDADIAMLFVDAFDAHLLGLDTDEDFPAVAVPAWMGFRARYVSDVTGTLIDPDSDEELDDLVREAIAMVEEVRAIVEAETGRHEDRDRGAFYETYPHSTRAL
jgi:hypothetical protein